MERISVNEAAVARMRTIADASVVCMVITVDATSSRNNRPVDAVKIDDDGSCWFFASRSSGKLRDLSTNNKLQLVLANPDLDEYLEIHGVGSVVCDEDELKNKWSPLVNEWFPGGIKDPEICLVKIAVTNVFYWDAVTEGIQRLVINDTTTVVEARKLAA